MWTPLSYFVATMHLFSQSLSIVLRCWGQLLNVIVSFLSTRSIGIQTLVPIRVSCRVIDVVWLGLVCCRRLIRTLIAVCSASLEFEVSSHERVFGKTLVHEFQISYSHTERHLLSSRGEIVFALAEA